MHFRSQAALASALLLTTPAAIVAPVLAQDAAKQPPQTALVRAVRGRDVTLAIGKEDGTVIGAVYRFVHGNTQARAQITAVRDTESSAVVISQDQDFVITVGDTAQFVEIAPLGGQTLPAPSGPLGGNPTPPPTPAVPPPAPTATGTTPDATAATQAVITAVNGRTVTLDITADTGAKVGAVYAVPLTGNAKLRMQIVQVRPNGATAQIFEAADDFTLTVGDSARFEGIKALGGATAPVPVPANPSGTQVTPVLPPGTGSSMTTPGAMPPSATVQTVNSGSIHGSSATITATNGATATIGAGTAQGITTGTNMPIIRSGQVVGLLRVQIASENSSTAVVLWRDESQQPIGVGDEVGILNAPTVGQPRPQIAEAGAEVPAVPVRYERGASNTVVPKADVSYELLATLAAKGYITSQPASIFSDDGTRRHRTAEDVTFSRSDIAGFIQEAIDNAATKDDSKPPVALSLLAKEFESDLKKIGVSEETINGLQKDGFKFSTGGVTRLTAVGGDKDSPRLPFPERFGGLRTKSGLDTRLTAFGQVSKNLTYYATLDGGSDLHSNGDNDRYDLRRGYISYKADSWLRGLTINLGRQEFWWGTGHFGTTLLSDTAGGLNSLHTVFKRGSYQLEGLYSPLGTGPDGGKRALYGQNLSVKLGNQAKIGIANTILSPKDDFDPKLFLAAFSPISLYTADRLGSLKDKTNALVQGYFETSIGRGVRTYGEVLLDDFSLNANNRIENRDGAMLGAHIFDPKNPARLGFYTEYARFNSINYLTFLNATKDNDYDYYYRGAPLGYPIAPIFPPGSTLTLGGSESLRLEGYWMPTTRLRLIGGLEFSDLNAEDQATGAAGTQGFSRQQIYRLAATYDLTRAFSITARVQRVATDQPNFIKLEPSITDKLYSFQVSHQF